MQRRQTTLDTGKKLQLHILSKDFSSEFSKPPKQKNELHKDAEAKQIWKTSIVIPVIREIPVDWYREIQEEQLRQTQQKRWGSDGVYFKTEIESGKKWFQRVHYDLTDDDFEWLDRRKGKIEEKDLEFMLDKFEKVQNYHLKGLVHLVDVIYGMKKKDCELPEGLSKRNLKDIYAYWKERRLSRRSQRYAEVGKPLLRDFEIRPDVNSNDINEAFRPRDKEKVTRRRIQNHAHHFEKLLALEDQFKELAQITSLVVEREERKSLFWKNEEQIFLAQFSYIHQFHKRGVKRKSNPMPRHSKRLKLSVPKTIPYSTILQSQQKIYPFLVKVHQLKEIPGQEFLFKKAEFHLDALGNIVQMNLERKDIREMFEWMNEEDEKENFALEYENFELPPLYTPFQMKKIT